MRKFISILSAAALAASVTVVPITAGAEGETVLYSDSMDGYETSVKSGTTTVFAVQAGTDYSSVQSNPDWQWIFNSPASQELDKLTVGFEMDRGDDTAAIMIEEKEEGGTDKYISLPQNRFQSRCKPQISGFNNYTAKDGEDLVIAFDLRLTPGLEGSPAATPSLSVDGIGTVSLDNISADAWVPIRIVTSEGMSTIYVDGTAVGEAVAGTVSVIKPTPFASDERIEKDGVVSADNYATIDLDNLVIMSAADGVNATIPNAETHTPAGSDDEEIPLDFTSPLFDFETDATSLSAVDGRSVVTSVIDGISEANTSKVLSIAGSSNGSEATKFGYSTIDLSEYTAGKARVVVEYDAFIANAGRMTYVLMPDMPEQYAETGIFRQGLVGKEGATAATLDEWIHTKVDVNLKNGTGTYTVTKKADDSLIAGAKITTDAQKLKYLAFLTWSPNTSYIDNIQISAGGSMEVEEDPTASPEPAAEGEGSYLDLKPESAQAEFARFANAAAGAGTKVVNHSDATAAAEQTISIYAENTNIRGKVVVAEYDVLVNAGDKLTLAAYNKTDLGAQFILQGNADGTATASYWGDSKDNANIEGSLVCGTWYRVKIEIPQLNNGGVTNTGAATYTISRIDTSDVTKTTEVAAVKTGIGPRNLADRAATEMKTTVTGTPYIDNGVTYLVEGAAEQPTPPSDTATPEPEAKVEGSGVNLVPATSVEQIADAFKAVEGTPAEIKNHSAAKPAQAGDISAYSESARGYSIFAAYDVYVKSGDKLNLAAYGNGNKLGPQFVVTGNADGTATAAYIQKDSTEVSLGTGLVNDTWYRVVIEIPQVSNEGQTAAGESKYSVYRIDPNDCSKTIGAPVVSADGIGARNLAAIAKFTVSITGTPAIDNGVVYRAKTAAETWYRYHFSVADGIKTVTSIELLTELEGKTDKLGKEYYIWNGLMQPYVAPAAE